MGAECIWKVRVLRTVEDTIEVSATGFVQAVANARSRKDVVAVLEVNDPEQLEPDRSFPQSG